jgi:hypothetical protein
MGKDKVNIHVHEGGNNVKERFLERQRQIIKNKKHLKGNLKIIAAWFGTKYI